MKILITIPTWNEAAVIEQTLTIVCEVAHSRLAEHEVTIEVADNGSTDETRVIVERYTKCETQNAKRVKFRSIPTRGKGLAIRRSWEQHLATSDVLLFTDADLAADLSVLPEMIRLIEHKEADLVCGSRFVAGARVSRRFLREIASHAYRVLQLLILRLPVQDAQCGLKAISASAARQLLPLCRETGWMFDSEILFLAKRECFRVKETPVSWVEHRNPDRRSAIWLFRDGWVFLLGLARISITH